MSVTNSLQDISKFIEGEILGDNDWKAEIVELVGLDRHYEMRVYKVIPLKRQDALGPEYVPPKVVEAIRETRVYKELEYEVEEQRKKFESQIDILEEKIKELMVYKYTYDMNYEMKHGQERVCIPKSGPLV